MRSIVFSFFAMIALSFAACMPLITGCDHLPPPLAPPVPTPPPQVLLLNGSAVSWFGNALAGSPTGGCLATAAVTAVTDALSGSTNTLRLSSTCNAFGIYLGAYVLTSPVTVNPSPYYSKGHLQFDIRLEQPPANFTQLSFQYLNSTSGNNGTYDYTASINSLSTSSFTHVSIPFTSFSNGYIQTSIDQPFYVSWQTNTSGDAMTLDNVQWTFN